MRNNATRSPNDATDTTETRTDEMKATPISQDHASEPDEILQVDGDEIADTNADDSLVDSADTTSDDDPENGNDEQFSPNAAAGGPPSLTDIALADSARGDDGDDLADPADDAELRGILEALIFASDEPLTFKQVKELLAPDQQEESDEARDAPGPARRKRARLTITRVKRATDALNEEYQESGRAFRIIEVSGGFAFQTTGEYGAWVGRLFAERSRRRLTQSALETLAIIAFRQPISKPAIESIRGVNAEYVVKSLLERNLISIVGREDSPGRPLLYGTTKTFLKHFGLSSINDLPKPREIEDLLSSEDDLGVNPIDEMDPGQAMDLTKLSSQELERMFDTARLRAENRDGEETENEADNDASAMRVTLDTSDIAVSDDTEGMDATDATSLLLAGVPAELLEYEEAIDSGDVDDDLDDDDEDDDADVDDVPDVPDVDDDEAGRENGDEETLDYETLVGDLLVLGEEDNESGNGDSGSDINDVQESDDARELTGSRETISEDEYVDFGDDNPLPSAVHDSGTEDDTTGDEFSSDERYDENPFDDEMPEDGETEEQR